VGNTRLGLKRESWIELARSLDWELTYVDPKQAFPEVASGRPWLPDSAWQSWDEPYHTTYGEYVDNQHRKEQDLAQLRSMDGGSDSFAALDPAWRSAVKLHAATLPLAEFAAVVGNLRAGRFGRTSRFRTAAAFAALDELRHTQIPLLFMHERVPSDPQLDWTHKLFHTDNWIAIAGRRLVDELLLLSDPIEFAIATHFVFETGFTNLQFVGLSANARRVGDSLFAKMLQSIQTDEARHSQSGHPVLEMLIAHDKERAQYLVDKWFWRSWLFFSVVTGFAMDYLTPLAHRTASFKEFVEEWVLGQFQSSLAEFGLALPWYWSDFLRSIESYHHMVYASAYTYRATVWFDMALPGPAERAWLLEKYPNSFVAIDSIWERVTERCRKAGPNVEWNTHGFTPIGFCSLCQLVLSGGTPERNSACTIVHDGVPYIFCSAPCRFIFQREPERYAGHKDVVKRILAGEAPGNLLELLRHFDLSHDAWGKDVQRGAYPFLARSNGDPLLGGK
jgi:toluene monooxygenase system protein A